MGLFPSRFSRRWNWVRRFTREAHSWRDCPALALAGFVRGRPFEGGTLYARLGRTLARQVTPRIRQAGGARVRLDLTTVTDLMIFEEIFLDQVYPLERVPFTPEVVIDGGACTGCFTLLAHARYPTARLIAIEPEPNNFARLERHLRDNGIAAQCHAAALANAPGKVRFTGSGFGGHVMPPGSTASGIEVQVVSLNELVQAAAPARLLIKLDVEGMEREILPSLAAILPRITALFLETHHPEAECQRYLAPLISSGFAQCIIRSRPAKPPAMAYVERLLVRGCD